ncbi:hypothetical protein FH608_046330 [Nonomuraea phyllanthi]|uniref:Uncharacterized protein n=1 Tax=Nonomuraea phyllanthi TaxID=2219224 RepID=A0A5C4V6D0_9ACTN|nr:hypothetical protein [Nonomuraea phyllanthi]KAB8186912.1 hypothetical protein FH608_046330 [Nonomuraea phyllanthi]
MLGKLVATGNPDADAYLRIARKIRGIDAALATATERVEAREGDTHVLWWPAVSDANPLGYERAAAVVFFAPGLMDRLWGQAQEHLKAARAGDEWAAELVDLHAGRLWDPAFTLDT